MVQTIPGLVEPPVVGEKVHGERRWLLTQDLEDPLVCTGLIVHGDHDSTPASCGRTQPHIPTGVMSESSYSLSQCIEGVPQLSFYFVSSSALHGGIDNPLDE
jgi:hypothetical protein